LLRPANVGSRHPGECWGPGGKPRPLLDSGLRISSGHFRRNDGSFRLHRAESIDMNDDGQVGDLEEHLSRREQQNLFFSGAPLPAVPHSQRNRHHEREVVRQAQGRVHREGIRERRVSVLERRASETGRRRTTTAACRVLWSARIQPDGEFVRENARKESEKAFSRDRETDFGPLPPRAGRVRKSVIRCP
jgi:hypothetical protein